MLFVVVSIVVIGVFALAYAQAISVQSSLRARVRDLGLQLDIAQQHLKRRSYLASEVAHDIKNPLTAIICSAEALELMIGESLAPTHRKSLRFICEYGDQLLRLLSDFIDINRIQTGHIESKKDRVLVGKTCEAVIGLLNSIAERKEIAIITTLSEFLPEAWIDPAHLKQILFNLVHNAVKFSYANSEVYVRVHSLESRERIFIEIVDSGPGIALCRHEEIFNPYAHFDNPQLPELETGGVGLGLALCRSLAELEGCEINLRSIPGQGATFVLSIPVCKADPAVSLAPLPVVQEDDTQLFNGKRILLVDSDQGARESVSLLISALGGISDAARNIDDALANFIGAPYDAVLLYQGDSDKLAILSQSVLVESSTQIYVSSSEPEVNQPPTSCLGLRIIEKPINRARLASQVLARLDNDIS